MVCIIIMWKFLDKQIFIIINVFYIGLLRAFKVKDPDMAIKVEQFSKEKDC